MNPAPATAFCNSLYNCLINKTAAAHALPSQAGVWLLSNKN